MPKKNPNPTYQELSDVINACNVLKYRLGQVGMWRAFRKMDAVTQELGWEMADIIRGKHTTKLAQIPETAGAENG